MIKKRLFFLLISLILLPQAITYQEESEHLEDSLDELVIKLTVNVFDAGSINNEAPIINSINGQVLYESKSELNKKKIPYIIIGTLVTLLIILILKKTF